MILDTIGLVSAQRRTTTLNYPSRKIIWLIIIAAILVGGAFVFAGYDTIPTPAAAPTQALSVAPAEATSTAIATDGDWQKALVGTGIGAGQGKSLGTEASSEQAPSLTTTDKIGQALVSQYIALGQNGGAINSNTINAAVSQVLNNPNIIPPAKVYSFSDIKIGKDDSQNADLAYAESIGPLFNNNSTKGNNEATDARDSVEQNDPAILTKIDPVITAYKNILNGLLATVAPPSIAAIHLDMVNAMSERLSTAQLLQSINSDPAAGLVGVGRYLTGVQDMYKAFEELRVYFASRGFNFGTAATSTQAASTGH